MELGSKHSRLAGVLADLSDTDVLELLAQAEPLGTGIGGSTARASVQGCDVFAKQVPLTALENDDPLSTANRFHLPVACHYGIGSPGFGVGREILAHQITSDWVTSGVMDTFPTLLHWRALDVRCATDLSEFENGEARRQWGHYWPTVRIRVDALKAAPRSIVLFLEYVPDTLGQWLRKEFLSGDGGTAFTTAIEQITNATAWMNAQGLQHLDLHEQNILVREGRLLFTDFGLALHNDFALDQNERDFFAAHSGYDHDAGISSLLHWMLAESGVVSRARRLEILRAAVDNPQTIELDGVRALLGDQTNFIAQYSTIGVSMTTLFDELMHDASSASYGSEFGVAR